MAISCYLLLMQGEEFANQMLDANEAIFVLSGDLKLSLPLYKVLPSLKWRKLIKSEDFFYGWVTL